MSIKLMSSLGFRRAICFIFRHIRNVTPCDKSAMTVFQCCLQVHETWFGFHCYFPVVLPYRPTVGYSGMFLLPTINKRC